MPVLEWGEKYMLGIPAIDEQHKTWLQAINDLHDAMKTGKGKDKVGELLKFVSDYTTKHFNAEEVLMRSNKYPDYEAHKKLHEEFVRKIQSVQADYAAGKLTVSIEFSQMLSDWLKKHIMETDRQYVPFLKK